MSNTIVLSPEACYPRWESCAFHNTKGRKLQHHCACAFTPRLTVSLPRVGRSISFCDKDNRTLGT